MPDDELIQLTESQMIRLLGCITRAGFLITEAQQILLAVQSKNGKTTAESSDKYLHDLGYRFRAISDEVLGVRAGIVGDDLISEDVINSVQDMLGGSRGMNRLTFIPEERLQQGSEPWLKRRMIVGDGNSVRTCRWIPHALQRLATDMAAVAQRAGLWLDIQRQPRL